MSIEEKQQDIVEEFSMFEDWMDKYEYIISIGKELPSIEDNQKVEDNLVKGCQSQVWLISNFEDGQLNFKADSDAMITKGLIGLLVRVLSGYSPKEIMNAELHFIDEIGLKEHLSPNRANGLAAMVKKMKTYSIAYNAINN